MRRPFRLRLVGPILRWSIACVMSEPRKCHRRPSGTKRLLQQGFPLKSFCFSRRNTVGMLLSLLLTTGIVLPLQAAMDNEMCLMCHSDMELTNEDGELIGVSEEGFAGSVHSFLSCTDCHDQDADYEDIPHFPVYKPVDCSSCHDDATQSFMGSFHHQAQEQGVRNAPDCSDCHGLQGNPHRIQRLTPRTAERACMRCHTPEANAYDGSVHAVAAQKGKSSPGCVSCHPTHSEALPPSAGAVNAMCESCHQGAMESVMRGPHGGEGLDVEGVMSCSACHDVHATHIPEVDEGTIQACTECHPGIEETFAGSVHEDLFEQGTINCISCHRTHQVVDAHEVGDFGCGRCHEDVEADYRTSVHRMARLRGDEIAADCADCHEGHHILPATDPQSPVNHQNIPDMCGTCHTDSTVITQDYVRLPISLPSYQQSVHGIGLEKGLHTAVCTDCHGDHSMLSASDPQSMINKRNEAQTCGKCHKKVSDEYIGSIHARALAHGINDSPSCTDCHDEHLILATDDPEARVNPQNQADEACGSCHTDPEMAVRYGLPPEVVESYQDSYHGWAIKRGGEAVAVCEDCHNTHDIRSRRDPTSSIHPNHVVETCGRCHPGSNPKFAASYSHVLARDKMMIHDYVRIIYIVLIAGVLGGMFVHNTIIMIHELKLHYKHTKRQKAVRRMTKSEVWQHIALAVTFIGLAITGFALRGAEQWWAQVLSGIGMDEETRRIVHRILAVGLVIASVYHVFYLIATQRGRTLLRAIFPKMRDVTEAIANVSYYLGLRKKPVTFHMYDYTQKAEYWALIWGTAVMALTGAVLWFPEATTSFTPAWVVRVAATIHFYEAILAVGAIIIWHFFFTIFHPKQYPQSWIWITGRMTMHEWEHHHGREPEETGEMPEVLPPANGEEADDAHPAVETTDGNQAEKADDPAGQDQGDDSGESDNEADSKRE
ncbi:DUF4405 domain-containing protein [bacterium]|nr:DUF4405 domain-containing protein [bacterium]